MSRTNETKAKTDWKSNAKKKRERGLIETTWAQIISLYDDRPVAVHMVNILRSKGSVVGKKPDGSPIYRDPYYLTDEEVLKIMEGYKEELDIEALESAQSYDNEIGR